MTPHGPKLSELSAGFVSACLTVPLCVGAGILAYGPLGPDHAARGAVAGLYGAIIGGAVAALARHSSFVVTFPTTPICALQAGLAASLLPLCRDLPSFELAMTLALVLMGVWQALFAVSGFSHVVRWVPHPVMAGFVSGIAVFIAWHQVPALLGDRSTTEVIRDGLRFQHPWAAVFGATLLALILVIPLVAPRIPNLIAGLLVGSLAFHGMRLARPALDLGRTIGALPSTLLDISRHVTKGSIEALLATPHLVTTLLTGSLTLAVVGTLDTFFALRTAQFIANIPVTPRRDVLGQGTANVVSALCTGLAVSTSLSVSMANHHAGGRSRLSSLWAAATLLLGGLLFPRMITSLPTVVIAAVLIAVSTRLFDRSCWTVLREAVSRTPGPRRRGALRDGLVILAVFLATVVGKPVTGVLVGVALSGVLFVIDMSRPVVARRRDGATVQSKRLRSTAERAALRERAAQLQLLQLQGALFFGNAQDLATELDAIDPGVAVVVLDGRALREVDTTGLQVLQQVAARYSKAGRRVLLAGASQEWVDKTPPAAPGQPQFVFSSLESALECAEDVLLRSSPVRALAQPTLDAAPISPALVQVAPRLMAHLETVTLPAGSVICRVGDTSDRMWILMRGTVRVQGSSEPDGILLTRLGPGSTFGEIGLLDHGPRSASVIADEEVEAFVLTREELARILTEDPETGQAVHAWISRQLARRVREMSGELGEAERSR